jgi:proline iminopeptidase
VQYSQALTVVLVFVALMGSSSRVQAAVASDGFIQVTGGSVWYKVSGSGSKTPLLLIHGGPGGSSCGLAALDQLAVDRKVIFYDQLGSGKSEQPADLALWNIIRFVDELEKVRTALHLQRVHLLAHSWGAAIAAQYLLSRGTRGIESVIFVGPYLSSNDWVRDTRALRKQLSTATQLTMSLHELVGTTQSAEYQRAMDEFYQRFLSRSFRSSIESDRCLGSVWNQTIYETMWGNSEFLVSGNLKNFDAAKDLNRIKIPTLFFIGEFDEVRESTARRYQQRMDDANVVVLKNAAHMSMVDEPAGFVSAVDDFLKRIESALPSMAGTD